ncbi:MAG: hypothetical protein IIB38_00065, partial [Candidatus Hydrogenedentes bacterium]|nr:hypothetical protein [Candidatus Hydrogenedentota bacterium]
EHIAERMKDYCIRQIAWFEEMSVDFSRMDEALGEPELAQLAEEQLVQQRKTESLAEEFRGLKREWDDCDTCSEEDRTAIRELAQRADALSVQLQARIESTVNATEMQKAAISETMGQIRQRKGFLGKFRASGPDEPGYFDQKA